MPTPLDRLRYHVSGAIARGEADPVVEMPSRPNIAYLQFGAAGEPMQTVKCDYSPETDRKHSIGRLVYDGWWRPIYQDGRETYILLYGERVKVTIPPGA